MQLALDADRLDLSLEGWEHLWAFKIKRFSVPLAHVVRAEAARPQSGWMIRAPGTHLPGVIKAGTYFRPGHREFWYVRERRAEEPLAIELRGEKYTRLVVSVDDARGWAERINAAVGR